MHEKEYSKNGLKILFIIDNEDFIDPMGPSYLLAVAKKAGHNGNALILSNSKNPFKEIEDYKPDVIAYSAVTGTHQKYFSFNKKVKEYFPNIFTIMGGAHPTFYPNCVKDQPIDAICIGEGEGAFTELLDKLAGEAKTEDLYNIANLGFPNGPTNPVRPLITDLDSLPFPDRDTIFEKSLSIGNFPLKTFITSRGCPFNCSYCFETVLKELYRGLGKYVRRHSVDHVIDEILDLKKRWPVEFIKFEDDLFVVGGKDPWLEEFAEKYPQKVGIPFNVLLRVDSINENTAKLLSKAGCTSVNTAIDSESEQIRKEVIGKNFSNEMVVENFKLLKHYGINVFNNMILGLPPTGSIKTEDIIKADEETINLEIAAGVKFSSRTILVPYPGTKLGKQCEDEGYFKMEVDDFGESILGKSPLNCFSEKEKDIQKNILYLSGLAVWQPWLAPFIKKHVIYRRGRFFESVFFIFFYLVKVYTLKKFIYPIKIKNPIRGLKDFVRGLFIEFFRTIMKGKQKNITYPAPKNR
ncbi:B12-binding domain-containing radical SAM protein [Patescibacteria group bacterium]